MWRAHFHYGIVPGSFFRIGFCFTFYRYNGSVAERPMTCSSTYHRALLHIYLHYFVLEHRNSYSMVLFAILACSTVLLFKLATSLLGVDVVVIGILEYLKINLTTLQWLLCRRSHARSHAFVIRFIVAVTDCFLFLRLSLSKHSAHHQIISSPRSLKQQTSQTYLRQRRHL